MSFEDLPVIEIPFPEHYSDFARPVIITQEYYETLSDVEKMQYSPINID